jgi:hypothetical protein
MYLDIEIEDCAIDVVDAVRNSVPKLPTSGVDHVISAQ